MWYNVIGDENAGRKENREQPQRWRNSQLERIGAEVSLAEKIARAIDWTKIYPIVEGKYSKIGRPSVDPVVLVKMVMLQHLYGIRSLRQTVAEIEVNVAYRWFIGYGLTERIPHFSTVSYNFLHRFDSDMFEQIFTLVLNEGIDEGRDDHGKKPMPCAVKR